LLFLPFLPFLLPQVFCDRETLKGIRAHGTKSVLYSREGRLEKAVRKMCLPRLTN
jgi:hypothetical protein